ncbi:hypothetical protein OWV82_017609 [Melia azedarach]|uniref:Uncharacterized protein n=1 Tax=Melia azedarach TaxID=155640 RepID=A0ACC1XK68_MELAZ|nr:hypothetical protein OWV82_017609 [Melia azedarach]
MQGKLKPFRGCNWRGEKGSYPTINSIQNSYQADVMSDLKDFALPEAAVFAGSWERVGDRSRFTCFQLFFVSYLQLGIYIGIG